MAEPNPHGTEAVAKPGVAVSSHATAIGREPPDGAKVSQISWSDTVWQLPWHSTLTPPTRACTLLEMSQSETTAQTKDRIRCFMRSFLLTVVSEIRVLERDPLGRYLAPCFP